jgi:preprotein translocase subunit SecG
MLMQSGVEANLLESPVTTATVFIMMTSAIAYLYRARDKDRESEVTRLERQIERLEVIIEALRRRMGED